MKVYGRKLSAYPKASDNLSIFAPITINAGSENRGPVEQNRLGMPLNCDNSFDQPVMRKKKRSDESGRGRKMRRGNNAV
jgi:hypothetical protein